MDGFRKGTLALDIEVPEALKQAKSRLDLFKLAPAYAMHDVSYFNGHFYVYYGVVPAVVLFLPFRILAGHDLPLVLGALVFGLGAFLLVAWLWLRIVNDHFPRAGLTTRLAGIAAFGLAGGQWVLARRVSIWEPSIVAGNFFLVCMLASGYRALHARSPWGWLAGCGLALGLAAGSRPTMAVAGLGLIALVAAIGWTKAPEGAASPARSRIHAAFAAGLPLAAVVGGLLTYNWLRFGNPFELGLNYQLSAWNAVEKTHFRAAYIPYNFYLYFLAPPQWGRYFPFVHPIVPPARPGGYYGYEFVYGALIVCPVLWWTVFVPGCLRRADPVLRSFTAVVVAVAIPCSLVILCFDTAAARYETDFLPWFVLLGILGWGLLEDRLLLSGRKAARGVLGFGFLVCVAFSCATAFCRSAELHGILEHDNPDAYHRLSRIFNSPTALWERLTGYRGGAVEMNLAFAQRPIQSVEPLLVTGVEYQKDYVYVFYQRDNVVRFCYSHPGEPVASSADVTVEPGRKYPLRIECGSLYPPEGHPAYDGWLPEEVESFKRWVKIDFNGSTVLIDSRRSNEGSPGTLQVGKDHGGIYGRRFAGEITGVRRMGWSRPEGDLSSPGDFSMVVALPKLPPLNNQPLLGVGSAGRADLVGLRMTVPDQYRFVFESWRIGLWQSDEIPIPSDRMISFRVRLGPSLGLDENSPLGILARSVVIWKDGAPIWWHHTPYALEPNPPFCLMSNALGSSAMTRSFQGRFISARRKPLGTPWHPGPFAALEIELCGRGDASEPLVATGPAGRSDTLAIDWLEGGRARLLYDHWGQEIRSSKPFDWSDAAPNSVRIEMPSFARLDAPAEAGKGEGRLRIGVNGNIVWEEDVPSYDAPSGTVAVGRNTSGSRSASAELRCVVVDLRQDPRRGREGPSSGNQ